MGCGGSVPAEKPNAPVRGPVQTSDGGFYLLRDADFKGRDDRSTSEPCADLEVVMTLLARKPKQHNVCYALRGNQLVTITAVGASEMGNGAKWSRGADLIVFGKDTGHRSRDKILIALKDVDCCFGDGQVTGGVHSYDDALRRIIKSDNVNQTAYFFHSPSNRLIEKPKDRGANWVGYPNYGWLFLWADSYLSGGGGTEGGAGSEGGLAGGSGEGKAKDKGKGKAAVAAKAMGRGRWEQYRDIDMCGQGDVEILPDWKRHYSIDDLKRMVEERGYSAFTVSAGFPSFGHAALKKFPFALTKTHCKPISTCCRHPCTIYIYFPPEGEGPKPEDPASTPHALPGDDGYFRLIPKHAAEGLAICATAEDLEAHHIGPVGGIRAQHGGGPHELCRIALGPTGGGDSLWRKVDRDGQWFRLEPKSHPGSTLNVIMAKHRDARLTLWHDHHENSLFCHKAYDGEHMSLVPKHAPECALHGGDGAGAELSLQLGTAHGALLRLEPEGGGGKVKSEGEATFGGLIKGLWESVARPLSPSAVREYSFVSVTDDAFDTFGVLYAIGSCFGKAPYSNPADSGKVVVQWSGDCANFYSTQGGHKMGDGRQAASVICANRHPGYNATQWSQGASGAWFFVDLLGVPLVPTHFAYRNDYGGGGNHPRTFELQGSNDGQSWTRLSKHTGEKWSGKGAKHWPISGCEQPFTKFRVINQGAPNHLCCAGIELYGRIAASNGESPPPKGAAASSSTSMATPVVMGVAVTNAVSASSGLEEAVAPAPPKDSAGSRPLIDSVAVLKRELGLDGNVNQVIHDAAVQLGVASEGKALVDVAAECMAMLGHANASLS